METIWRHKSRENWCKLGDRNTKYFHLATKINRSRNSITTIRYNGKENTTPEAIKESTVMFFSKIFDDKKSPRAVIGNTGFKSITPELFAWMEQDVTLKEIKQAIWSCDASKALGSDGFILVFFFLNKKAWTFIGSDVLRLVNEFFKTGRLLKGINTAYVASFNKCKEPTCFSDYRPISLINGFYKIIAKVARLKVVMIDVINFNQTKFILGRHILDGFILGRHISLISESFGHFLL
jgi:hypothetical protein